MVQFAIVTSLTMARSGTRILIYLSLIIAFLLGTTGFLLMQNRSYRNVNRSLIIQNDSVISANIELSRALSTAENAAKRGHTARIKGGTQK